MKLVQLGIVQAFNIIHVLTHTYTQGHTRTHTHIHTRSLRVMYLNYAFQYLRITYQQLMIGVDTSTSTNTQPAILLVKPQLQYLKSLFSCHRVEATGVS